jgi:beta-mannosidase
MRSHLILILLFFGNYSFSQFKVLEINENWKFRQEGTDQWMHANVPGTVHTDLLTNEKIIDPFACGAEKELQWIENENWEYTCEFYVSEEQLNYDRHELVFEGLDTYAEVFLNGEQILEANNMFLKYRVDIYELEEEGKTG